MKKEQLKKLQELYLEDKTSRDEEDTLKEYYKGNSDNDNAWFEYIQENKNRMPEKLEHSLSSFINKKQQSAKLVRRSILSAAAIVVVVLVSVLLKPPDQMTHKQIIATLEEAYMMIDKVENDKEVLFEDEALIIYLNK